jgi:hypothetical protein
MASEMLEAEASKTNLEETVFPAGLPINRKLFNWITLILLTGWVLVVGVAANTARVEKPIEHTSDRVFIKNLL